LIELMVVIVILALLIALLLPALNGAMRTARNAAVSAEINQLAQALASFKSKYGEYPPSRVLLAEDGHYTAYLNNTRVGPGDIEYNQLCQRSIAALRKYFPNVVLNTSGGPVFPPGSARWYDFNGDGVMGTLLPDGTIVNKPYILQGHECLVFFLGGIPQRTDSGFGMTGFGKDPTNPFSNSIPTSTMYSNNRQPPMFEFAPNRLMLDPFPEPYDAFNGLTVGNFPAYLDSLGNAPPAVGSDVINFYAYFSSYGNNAYDPNDVNFTQGTGVSRGSIERDAAQRTFALNFHVAFPTWSSASPPTPVPCESFPPTPYTSSLSVPATGNTATFLNPQTFQIISSGIDGLYGPGGQYLPDSTEALPPDLANMIPTPETDTSIRKREKDNVTNVHNGRLE
jgi:general secretion pathway protein G